MGADVIVNNLTNATSIGANALVGQSNSIVLGDTTQSLSVGIGTAFPQYELDVRGQVASQLFITKAVPVAINATATATAAQVASGYISSTSASATTITLPTATLLATQVNAKQGTSFDFVIDNTAGASTITVALGTGITQLTVVPASGTGGLTVASGAAGLGIFRIVFTSATTAVITRLG